LPAFLLNDAESTPRDWADGLALTGHFLARDAFGAQHLPLPPARERLADRVAALADSAR
jgi:DNA repair protein RecO (recombination protein O)